MIPRLDRAWRIVATGAAFACIFFGGGVLAAVLVPCLVLVRTGRQERVQRTIGGLFRFYLVALQALGLLRLEFVGAERLRAPGGRLVIANHPSLLDVVMLMALVPRAQCIVKHQLWNHRFLGPLMRSAGYIRNDLEPAALIAACQAALAAGQTLIVFPEGTRSEPGHAPRFLRGFANIAAFTEAELQLVVITCDPPTLIKGEPWWNVPPRRPTFRLVVDKRLDARDYLHYAHRSVATRRLVKFLEEYYAEKLGYV